MLSTRIYLGTCVVPKTASGEYPLSAPTDRSVGVCIVFLFFLPRETGRANVGGISDDAAGREQFISFKSTLRETLDPDRVEYLTILRPSGQKKKRNSRDVRKPQGGGRGE